MFIAVDVGNTQTTAGLFDAEGNAVHSWRMSTEPTDTSDMLHSRLWGYFNKDGFDLADIDGAAFACVVPVLARGWEKCLAALTGTAPLRIEPGMDAGIELAVDAPGQVGADRIANAVAARSAYGAPVIVVDFGTATNIDVVDASGAYRGGAISPGLVLSANALFEHAAKLSSIEIKAPAASLGASTEAAVQSGLVVGAAAQAEGLVERIKEELGAPDAKVIGTGGLARTVSAATDLFDAVDPGLTLRGIREIWLYASGS